MKIRTIWKSASCAVATLLCCFSLRAQAAAEYKERAETEKSWPKEAVRSAHGRTGFLDYREVAPGKATRDMYIKPDGKLDNEASVIGYKSVAVPGTVAGLELALKTYGTMK